MYIACKNCQQQYDIGDLLLGSKIHCHCGQHLTVPKVRARDAEVLHCSSCGANLEKGAASCQYCGSVVSACTQNLGPACPVCYARMVKGASFCSACGVEIRTEKIHTSKGSWDCPRCQGKLVERRVRNGTFSECTSCGGIWLRESSFEHIVEKRDSEALGAFFSRKPKVERQRGDRDLPKAMYLPCPICQELMHRKNFVRVSGIIIDWCKGHGYWFDIYELESIVEFIQGGGMNRARTRELEETRRKLAHAQRQVENRPALLPLDSPLGSSTHPVDLFDVLGSLVRMLFK